MIKKGGLGTIPKGLEWIVHKNGTSATEVKLPEVESIVPSLPHEIVVHPKTEPVKEQLAPSEPTQKAAVIGLPPGFTRATFIIKQEHVDRLKAIAFVRKMAIKDVVDEIMISFLKDTNVQSILLESLRNKTQEHTPG